MVKRSPNLKVTSRRAVAAAHKVMHDKTRSKTEMVKAGKGLAQRSVLPSDWLRATVRNKTANSKAGLALMQERTNES